MIVRIGYNVQSEVVRDKTPEARYAYYRRCQRFKRNGEQCKAPAVRPMALRRARV